MTIGRIETRRNRICTICGGEMRTMLDLPGYPLTEIYEPYSEDNFSNFGRVDQAFLFCERCTHARLETIIAKEFLYRNYRTTTAQSIGSMNAVKNFIGFVQDNARLADFDTIVDIGANDATLLESLNRSGVRRIAIDPNSDKSVEGDLGITVISDFIENVDLAAVKSARTLFLSSHTLEHIEDPSAVLAQLRASMSSADVCAFQFPSLDLLIRDARFDQIHHQHLNYFSERSITLLCEKVGFEVITTRFDPDHYGTLMLMLRLAQKPVQSGRGHLFPASRIADQRALFDADLKAVGMRIRSSSRSVLAYGAGLMLPLVAYHIPEVELVELVVDDDASKDGLRFVNFNKKIVHSSKVGFAGKDVIVTALATKLALRKILAKLFSMNVENIIVPLNQV